MSKIIGDQLKNLYYEDFYSITGKLQNWRTDSFIQYLNTHKKGKGRVLAFVRGLRFSSLLIYSIRPLIKDKQLKANWGHLLDSEGQYLSNECDIIIHKNEHIRQWNGDDKENNSVMDFRFIRHTDAIAIISCKSFLKPGQIDGDYITEMKEYSKNIWLFAECCLKGKEKIIRNEAKRKGYKDFYFLYSWDEKSEIIHNRNGWLKFVGKIKSLKNR